MQIKVNDAKLAKALKKITLKAALAVSDWLDTSIFAPRRKFADSRSLYDTNNVVDKAFQADWNRVCEERFKKFLSREANVTSDEELVRIYDL